MKYVIIGNGIAGISAAEAIRELDREGEIVMVSDEASLPYSRPMISYVLDGSQPHEKLPIRPSNYYESMHIKAVLGHRVEELDVENRRLRLADSSKIDFDRLLIASGADARHLQVPGADLGNIFVMRTEKDVRLQLHALPGARRALVLGGGLVGFKAAHGLLKRGLEVTMLITSGYPLAMQVDETAGRMILHELYRHGLQVRVGASIRGFEGSGTVQAAVTDEGVSIPCDMVIIGKGVSPSCGFIPRADIKIDLGIMTDEHLQTTAEGIYAAGDVAESLDITRNVRRVNAIWPEAAIQGRIAGLNMAGRPVPYAGSMSRNVMRVYDLDVMTLGHAHTGPGEGCRIVCSGGPDKGFYRSLVVKDDVIVGAVLINGIEQGGVLRALIENRVPLPVPTSQLMAGDFNFAKLSR